MLKSNRNRFFFSADPDDVHDIMKNFAREHGGEQEEGLRSLAIYRFADPAGGRRFLTSAIKKEDNSGIRGNVTLRWRDEPDGQFHELAEKLEQRLKNNLELLSLAEARKAQTE